MRLGESLRQLSLRLPGRGGSAEDERLVELFRNRAELKKELTALDDERHRLLDRLKLQEGATMRVEEQLAALERYLGRPEEGYKSLAYFQLRAVWRAASRRLEAFSAELTRQQKDRERRQQLAEVDREKRGRIAEVDRELAEARVLADQLQAEQRLAEERLDSLAGVWNYFRRRRLLESITLRRARIDTALTLVAGLEQRRHAIESEAPPPFEGLSIEGRRGVNIAVVAYAEMLHERLTQAGVADHARQTTLRRVQDTSYGGRDECLALMQRAARAIADVENLQDDLADIRARVERLRGTAAFRGDGEVVPAHDSLGSATSLVLEEYWEIYKAFVR